MSDVKLDCFAQYADRAESWQRLLTKAASGSQKRLEVLRSAEQAFLSELNGNKKPNNLKLDKYYELLSRCLPSTTPLSTIHEF
jgi:hypothetical protein